MRTLPVLEMGSLCVNMLNISWKGNIYTQRNGAELMLLRMYDNFLILLIVALTYPQDQSTVVGPHNL